MIQEKRILNDAGENLFVETYTPEHIKATVVLCHGITGCRKGRTIEDSYFQDLAIHLMDNDYKVILFDYSGHGDSEGNDFDVCLSKSTSELKTVLEQEEVDFQNICFLAFSYGAAVLCNYLSQNTNISPRKIVFYSPALYPNESCFLNGDSIFGRDIVRDYESGKMDECGYAVVGAKGFRVGLKLIEECKGFTPDYLDKFSDRILVLSGSEDVILNTEYNNKYCAERGITNIYLKASHSLYEDINSAFRYTIDYFEK